MATALADLLKAKSQEEREAQLLAALNAVGFPVSDYFPGSVGRTITKMVAAGLVDVDELIPQIAGGGFLGPITVNGVTYPSREWLELIVSEMYGITPAPATFTKQRVALWHDAGTGPSVIGSVAQLVARSRFGRRYTNTTTGTVPAGPRSEVNPPLYLEFQAESPGAVYNGDISGTLIELVTPLPGLNISNEPRDFGAVVRVGQGTGTVTPSGTPIVSHRYTITITSSGQIAGGSPEAIATLDIDGVQTILSPLPASHIAGDGVTIAFANGGVNPSFVIGDVYTFDSLASPIISSGTDAETDDALRARARGRWPSLSLVPTDDRYVAWVRQASIDGGYGITKITVSPSLTRAGQADIRIATQAGAVDTGVVAAVQAYIDARDGVVDLANVQTAAALNVTAGGTAKVRRAEAAAVKAAAQTNWAKYVTDLPIGGSRPEGVVRLAELQEAIMAAGAVDVSGLTLNGVGANLALTGTQVAVAANSLDSGLTWQEVP